MTILIQDSDTWRDMGLHIDWIDGINFYLLSSWAGYLSQDVGEIYQLLEHIRR